MARNKTVKFTIVDCVTMVMYAYAMNGKKMSDELFFQCISDTGDAIIKVVIKGKEKTYKPRSLAPKKL